LPPQDIAEGTALVEAFLEAWAERTGTLPPSGNVEDRQEAELKELVGCFEAFKDRFDSSRWTKEVLAKTY
jgi:DNA mismatch repair protein MSH2